MACDIDMEQGHAAAALVVAKGVANEAGISFEESDCQKISLFSSQFCLKTVQRVSTQVESVLLAQ